jgi:hypothetical protein
MMKRILFVFGGLGPPTSYVLPRVKRHGDIYVYLAGQPSTVNQQILETYATAFVQGDDWQGGEIGNDELRTRLVAVGRKIRADAIVTFDEFRMVPVAEAAIELGLRGAGPHVRLARDKWEMRQAFTAAGIPSPRFAFVDSVASLTSACDVLRFPFVMKSTAGAASLGHSIVGSREDAVRHWQGARATLRAYGAKNTFHSLEEFREPSFIAEEIIAGTTRSWYPDNLGYGDYLSVEGLVCDGEYHPFGITARMPTIYPFTEVANQTPCVLSEAMQHMIAESARDAVLAMRSEFCGTHTEIKLMNDHGLCVIETAARLAGCYNVPQLERVYGTDLVDVLIEVLLQGKSDRLPGRMYTGPGNGAAGTLTLLPVDEHGVPWDVPPSFHSAIDWPRLISAHTTVELDWGKLIGEASPIARYDDYRGGMNSFGLLYLESRTPETLLRDQYAVRRGLRGELERLEASLGAPA